MINQVTLIGRLTRDVDIAMMKYGKNVGQFTLAVNRNYKNKEGNYDADFISCVIWGDQAGRLSQWAKKGSLIGITGRVQTRNYENQQGQRVYVTEIVADSFQILESRNSQSTVDNQQMPNFSQDQQPFGTVNPLEISEKDLPF